MNECLYLLKETINLWKFNAGSLSRLAMSVSTRLPWSFFPFVIDNACGLQSIAAVAK